MWMSVSMHIDHAQITMTVGAVSNFKTHTFFVTSEDLRSSNVTEMAQKCLTLEDVEEPNSSLTQ